MPQDFNDSDAVCSTCGHLERKHSMRARTGGTAWYCPDCPGGVCK